MRAAQATRMGFRWMIGDGKKIRFWENNWLGTSSIAIQYYRLQVGQ